MNARQMKKFILTVLLVKFSATSDQARAADERQEFSEFSSLRADILSKIGGATKRIWIVTDFMSEAEIVSSLFIAQYRKLDVSVLLGKERSTHVLSRLNYLKQVNIPVSLRPKDFYAKYRTVMLMDNQIFGLNTSLDYMSKKGQHVLESLSAEQVADFENRFSEAAKLKNAPQMAPLPQVGRRRPNSRYYKSSESSDLTNQAPQKNDPAKQIETSAPVGNITDPLDRSDASSAIPNKDSEKSITGYRYRGKGGKAPEGIPTKLPRTTLRQQLEQERERLRNSDTTKTPAAD